MGDKVKNSKDKSDIQWDIVSLNASSAKDMTGLIPRGPESEEELESYNEIMTYRPEKIVTERNEKRHQLQERELIQKIKNLSLCTISFE